MITVEVLFLPKRWVYTEVVDDSAQLSFGILFKHRFFESYRSWKTIVSNHYKKHTQKQIEVGPPYIGNQDLFKI